MRVCGNFIQYCTCILVVYCIYHDSIVFFERGVDAQHMTRTLFHHSARVLYVMFTHYIAMFNAVGHICARLSLS